MINQPHIAIIGLGYVGLPLAVAFAEKYKVIGFDINQNRVAQLRQGTDHTLEVSDAHLQSVLKIEESKGLVLSCEADSLADANIYIVTVPTPTDKNHRPVLTPLEKASETIGKHLKKGDVVVYESTVTKILKVTSGSTPEIAQQIDKLYASVITAGTHLAPSIKVAEAAKVIENSQRDINIAFVNELSKIFRLLDIDTDAVLDAAATKWNFIKFSPGLVGGHCIGVDPYYLAQRAQEAGYNPEIILAGRRMNDGMGDYVAQEVIKLMVKKEATIKNGKALVLGITFKENCPDVRNTKAIDVIESLKDYNLQVDVCDPWANPEEVKSIFNLDLITDCKNLNNAYDTIVLCVSHQEFLTLDFDKLRKKETVIFDVKSFLPKEIIDGRL